MCFRSIEQGKARHAETLRIALPPLIAKPSTYGLLSGQNQNLIITQKQVTGPIVNHELLASLAGAGSVFLMPIPVLTGFCISVAGLITAWGGANSHMAIRAGELGRRL